MYENKYGISFFLMNKEKKIWNDDVTKNILLGVIIKQLSSSSKFSNNSMSMPTIFLCMFINAYVYTENYVTPI